MGGEHLPPKVELAAAFVVVAEQEIPPQDMCTMEAIIPGLTYCKDGDIQILTGAKKLGFFGTSTSGEEAGGVMSDSGVEGIGGEGWEYEDRTGGVRGAGDIRGAGEAWGMGA